MNPQLNAVVIDEKGAGRFDIISGIPDTATVKVYSTYDSYNPEFMQTISKGGKSLLLSGNLLITIAENKDLVIYSVDYNLPQFKKIAMNNFTLSAAFFRNRKKVH